MVRMREYRKSISKLRRKVEVLQIKTEHINTEIINLEEKAKSKSLSKHQRWHLKKLSKVVNSYSNEIKILEAQIKDISFKYTITEGLD